MLSPHWLVEGAFHVSYLFPILSQFETRYKMVLILTLGLILLVLAGALVGFMPTTTPKEHQQCMTGLKLLKDQSQNAATNHAKTDIWFTMAAY